MKVSLDYSPALKFPLSLSNEKKSFCKCKNRSSSRIKQTHHTVMETSTILQNTQRFTEAQENIKKIFLIALMNLRMLFLM